MLLRELLDDLGLLDGEVRELVAQLCQILHGGRVGDLGDGLPLPVHDAREPGQRTVRSRQRTSETLGRATDALGLVSDRPGELVELPEGTGDLGRLAQRPDGPVLRSERIGDLGVVPGKRAGRGVLAGERAGDLLLLLEHPGHLVHLAHHLGGTHPTPRITADLTELGAAASGGRRFPQVILRSGRPVATE